LIYRKQRNTSAPPPVDKNNPELQQLRNHLESRKSQRLSKQQQQVIVPSSEHYTSSVVCSLISN